MKFKKIYILHHFHRSIVVARVEPNGDRTSLVDIEKIRAVLAANGVGVIDGDMPAVTVKPTTTSHNTNTNVNSSVSVTSEEVVSAKKYMFPFGISPKIPK